MPARASTATETALFAPDGELFVPTDYARGPWSPDALHGGPVAALVARAVEGCHPEGPMLVTRLTVELLRPVPVAPLAVTATVVRPGRRVQLVDVHLSAAGQELASARALRIRTLEDGDPAADGLAAVTAVGPAPDRDPVAPPGPDHGHVTATPRRGYRAFHSAGAELRFVGGEFDGRGPATVWVRLAVPVVPGETPSPCQRVAAAADFGNGVSSLLAFDTHLFINPDLTVYLSRPAVGEWICLDARTTLGTPGVGLAHSALWDVKGPIGRSIQGLMVERRI